MKPDRYKLLAAIAAMVALLSRSEGALVNLYTFNDGTANDSVGGAHANVVNSGSFTTVGTSGLLDFTANDGAGGNVGGAYLDLPNGLITTAVNSTAGGGTAGAFSFSVWFTASEHRGWAPVASFGSTNDNTEDGVGGSNATYIQLIPYAGTGANPLRLTTRATGSGSEAFIDASSATLNDLYNVIGVFDQSGGSPGTFSLYVNGTLVSTSDIIANFNLSTFVDNNNWLGRSQWPDSAFDGTYDEFAVYNHAIDATEAAAIHSAGPLQIPEPASTTLVGLALAAAGIRRRRS